VQPDVPVRRVYDEPARVEGDTGSEAGGEAACWAHLVCPECGAIESEGHRPGCSQAASPG